MEIPKSMPRRFSEKPSETTQKKYPKEPRMNTLKIPNITAGNVPVDSTGAEESCFRKTPENAH